MKVLLLLLLLIPGEVFAHGGEDHGIGSATAAPSLTGSQLRVVSYQGNLEILVKYPAPELQDVVTGRLYFADYPSNHPVNPSTIELSFPGALGAKVTKQPAKISDGIFEFSAIFIRDTNHTALLRYTYGEGEQLASLSPFYAGASAQRQLIVTGASSAPSNDSWLPLWLLIMIAVGIAAIGYVVFRRRRTRLLSTNASITNTSTTITTENKSSL